MLMEPQVSHEHGFLGYSQKALIGVVVSFEYYDRFMTFSGRVAFRTLNLCIYVILGLLPKCEV